MLAYFNPYHDQNFFGFFVQLMLRLFHFIQGDASNLATDEIQVLVLIGISASAALVGPFLILRRMTMLANSLSHTILIGIVLAYLFTQKSMHDNHQINMTAMLLASVVMGLVTTFLTEFLTKTIKLQEDASTGLVFTTLFAIGIILVTLMTRNAHIGTEVVMGNVDSLHVEDCKLVYTILLLNLVSFSLFFKEFKMTTFDPGFSRSLGISTVFFNYLLMTQVSATAIGAFRAVGVLMVLALITGPALMARLLTDDLKKMMGLSMLIGIGASLIGVALSRHILTVYETSLSTAGIVVCTIVFFFIITLIIKKLTNLIHRQKVIAYSLINDP